jgi:hypothetical protein
MMVYWADVRPWLLRGLTALGVTVAGAFGAMVGGGQLWVGAAIGAGYYLLTRFVAFAVRTKARGEEEIATRALCRQLRNFLRHRPHREWLISAEDRVLFQVRRRTGHGILRFRWDEADQTCAEDGSCVGTVPIEMFVAVQDGHLYRIREALLFEHSRDGHLVFHDGKPLDQRHHFAALKKAIVMEHQAGMYDVDNKDVEQLLSELIRVSHTDKPVHIGCEGDGKPT